MFIILALIILVAAINIVSTLVVAVTDKQADIAILRTLGAAPGSIMQIFIVQGMVIGVIGTLAGVACGIVTALNIDVDRAGDRERAQHQVPLEGRVPDPRPALGPAVGRRASRSSLMALGAVVPRHALSELERGARQSGGGAAV